MALGTYELEDGGWIHSGDKKTKWIEARFSVKPDKLDEIVMPNPPIPISAGAIVGYPGPYMLTPSMVHFEVLSGNTDFMKNPGGDVGGRLCLEVAEGSSCKTREAVSAKATTVNLGPGCVLQFVESCGPYAKVKCTSVAGWLEHSHIAFNAKTKKYSVSDEVTELVSDDPSKMAGAPSCAVSIAKGTTLVVGKKAKKGGDEYRFVRVMTPASDEGRLTGWVAFSDLHGKPGDKSVTLEKTVASLFDKNPGAGSFASEAGKSAKTQIADVIQDTASAGASYDEQGKLWYEVEYAAGKKGWLRRDDTKVLSSYDWPRWVKLEESGEFSDDGLCDKHELIDQIDTNADHELSEEELKAAASRFRWLACAHPIEWMSAGTRYERLRKGPWIMSKGDYDLFVKQLDTMKWWDGVPAKVRDELQVKGAASGTSWHLHPIGFVRHLDELVQGGSKVRVP